MTIPAESTPPAAPPSPVPAPPAFKVRRAGGLDAVALMPLANKFAAGAHLADKAPLHEESAHGALMRCLASGAGTGCVFVAEIHHPPHPDRPLEAVVEVIGGIMGEMRPVWFSRRPIAEHLGGFASDEAVATALRSSFCKWARAVQHAGCAIIDGVAVTL